MAKSATWLAHKSNPLRGPDWEHKWTWKVDTILKIQIFHQALLVRGTLIKRELHLDPSCLIYREDTKSMDTFSQTIL